MKEPVSFSAFYFKDFRLFWLGQIISYSGTWMHATAQGWLVYSLTKSPLYLGIVSAAGSLPVLFFTLIGGVVADRVAKRNLLLLTSALSIIPAVLIGVLTSMEIISVWHVMALAVFLGMVNAFDVPARQSFLVEMVEKGNLLNAIALNSVAFNGARIIGPIIAGMTIAYIGLPACFYLNALSFVAVIVALSMIKAKGEKRERKGLMKELLEGMRFVKNEPEVWKVMLIVAVFSLFAIPFITLLPVFAEEILKVGVKGFGFLAGSAGIGAFTAALILSFMGDIKGKQKLQRLTAIILPISLIVFSLSKDYYLSMASMVVTGWSIVTFLAISNISIQLKTPDGLRGRVMSLYTLVFLGMAPIGNTIIGISAHMLGVAMAVTIGSSICLLSSVIIIAGGKKT